MLKFAIAASFLLSSAGAWAQDARAPKGAWVVDFDDAQCVATRPYGSEKEPLHLVLKAPPLGDVMQVALAQKGGNSAAEQIDGTVRIDNRPALKTNLLTYSVGETKTRIYTLNMASKDFEAMRSASRIRIRSASLNENLALSQMENLLKIMGDCVADLRRVWNVQADPDAPSPLQQRAKGNLAGIITGDDYPGIAQYKELTGGVRIVALIDEKGRVADCTVVETSGVASLDAQTCALLKRRAKFEPAVGADGKPAKDAVSQRIVWSLM